MIDMGISNNISKISNIVFSLNPKAKILAVTKNQSINKIEEAINSGIKIIGENKWQEFEKKFVETRYIASVQNNIEKHFIGNLQTNKVKEVVKYFDCIQSINSLKLAKKIDSECKKINKIINGMIEINISGDKNKFGFYVDEINKIFVEMQYITSLQNINIIGFMTITAREDQKKIRNDFKKMKKLFDQYKEQYNLTELSMGMSGDYQIALEEGATMVRIGSAIF